MESPFRMSLIAWLLDLLRGGRAHAGYFIVGPVRVIHTTKSALSRGLKKEIKNIMFIITDEQEFDVEVKFVTQAGNPAKIDGAPVWTSSGPVEVLPHAEDPSNEFRKTVRRTGELGTFQVTATGDANLDPTVKRDITLLLDGEVVAAEAASGAITAGSPRLVPA